jgi:hypothetical protein
MKFTDRGSLMTHIKKYHTKYSPLPSKTGYSTHNKIGEAIKFFQELMEGRLSKKHVPNTIETHSRHSRSSARPKLLGRKLSLAPESLPKALIDSSATASDLAGIIAEAEQRLQELREMRDSQEHSKNTFETKSSNKRKRPTSSLAETSKQPSQEDKDEGQGVTEEAQEVVQEELSSTEEEDVNAEGDDEVQVPAQLIPVPRYKSSNKKQKVEKGQVCRPLERVSKRVLIVIQPNYRACRKIIVDMGLPSACQDCASREKDKCTFDISCIHRAKFDFTSQVTK